jgi:omega-amidase
VKLRVTLAQVALHWEAPARNLEMLEALLAPLASTTDLIVLPEMFTTGFSMQPERLAELAGGPTVAWLREQSARLDAAICGSVMTRDGTRHVNRLSCALPDGQVSCYDKRHLFRMGREHEHYAAGDQTTVVTFRGWRIALQVCYDLRFPVWSRRRESHDYDLLVYVANWPARRAFAWRQLLVARAIENQSCVVGVNRVGDDGHGVPHLGDSVLHDALGATVVALGAEPAVATGVLDLAALREFREAFPAQLDADAFSLAAPTHPL